MLKKTLLAFCVAAAFAATASDSQSEIGDSVLLWRVNTSDVVSDNGTITSVGEILSRGMPDSSANGQHVNAARVRVFQGDSAMEDTWLHLYRQENGSTWTLSSSIDLSFDEGQKTDDGGTYVGPSWADFGGYANSDYSFAIELGFLNDDCDWFTMAYGTITSYDELEKFRTTDIVADPGYVPWTSTYTVPEPSSGLLLLVGSALLALKRRKNFPANC